ncbi:MAG: TonB-dependent receptor [Alistipes sp.]|nr:TonB-dependent receptor [Alistipes sp.]
MRRLLTLCVALLSCLVAWGQGAVVSGRFFDVESKEGVVGAIVEITTPRDSLFRRHYTTGYGGYFKTPPLPRGEYKLTTTFIGYKDYEQHFKVDMLPLNLGDIPLSLAAIDVGVVVKEVVVPRAQIVGDTLRYSASQFKVTVDAELEGLLRKLPGISITNGRIEAQGEVVKKIYVDNEEFFGGNVQQVLQSIPAQAVESVEVYNRMSEASQITGVDDGDGGKVINIVTKGSLSHSEFGKVHAAGGYEPTASPEITQKGKYSAGGSVNIFRDDMRVAIMALANNMDKQNLSDEGISMSGTTNRSNASSTFSVNRQSGVAAAEIFAMNYSDKWGRRKRAKFDGNIFFNHNNSKNQFVVDRWYNEPAKIDTIHYDQFSNPDKLTLRLRGRLEWKVAKRQRLYLTPSYSYTDNFSINRQDTTSMRLPGSESGVRYYPSSNEGNARTHNAGVYGQYSYNFLKQGRVLLIAANVSHNENENWRNYRSYSGTQAIDALRKYSYSHNATSNHTSTFRINPTYREKIGRYVVLNVAYNFQYQMRDRDVRNYTTDDTYVLLEEKLKPRSSSSCKGAYIFHEASAGARYGKGRTWVSLNLKYRNTMLSTTNLWAESQTPLVQRYDNFLYNATANVAVNKEHSLRVSLNSKMKVPGLWTLIDLYNVNNTSYISVGNPNLKPSQEHNLFARYTNVSSRFGTTFMVMAKAEHIQNYAGTKIAYSPGSFEIDGTKYNPIQLSQQVNLDGYWSYELRTSLGLPMKHLRSNLNFVFGATYSDIPMEIVDVEKVGSVIDEEGHFSARGERVMMHNTNAYAQVTLGSNISENIDFMVTWRGSYSYNDSSLKVIDNQYFMHYARANIKAVLPLGFTISSSVNFTHFIGFTNRFNDHFTLWNISVGKKMLKGLGEVELCANDILNQNTSFSRYVWASYSQLRYNSVLGRTFLLRFTYNLRNLGGQSRRLKSDLPQDRLGEVQSKLDALRF